MQPQKMKKLIIVFSVLGLFTAIPTHAAIQFVQIATSTGGSGDVTSLDTVITGVAAGNVLIVTCEAFSGNNPTTITITDGLQKYIQDGHASGQAAQFMVVDHALNVQSGTHTVNCASSPSARLSQAVAEYSGLSNVTSSLVNASSSNSGASGLEVSSGNFTTTNANALLWGLNVKNAAPPTPVIGPSWTMRWDGSALYEPALFMDQIVSGTGTYNATSTGWTSSGAWGGIGIAYEAAAAAAAPAVRRRPPMIIFSI